MSSSSEELNSKSAPIQQSTAEISSNSSSNHDEKPNLFEVKKENADETFELIKSLGGEVPELTPEKERKLKRKLWYTVLPLCFIVNGTLFIEKDAVSYTNLLGGWKDFGLDQDHYNTVLTLFYVGYLVGQFPSHWAFQKYKMSHFLTVICLSWCLLTLCTLGVTNFAGFAAVRFFLGFVESGITPAVSHTLGMFFPQEELAIVNPIFWISCLGIDIPFGFVSYGLQHSTAWRPWKWYFLIVGIVAGIVCVIVFLIYPDNPATSKMFTIEERIHIINRVKKSTHSSIEQKTFKIYQFKEALKDKITWLFVLLCFFMMLENSTTYQSSTIYKALGFNNLTNNLLMVAMNGFSTIIAIVGAFTLHKFRSQSAYVAAIWLIPAFVGAILAMAIPYDNKAGILGGIFLTRFNGTAYIISYTLCHATAAGYTKKLTRTMLFMVSYAVSNCIAPQLWQSKYAPRFIISWTIQAVFSWFLAPLILLLIRFILAKRNVARKKLIAEDTENALDFGVVDVIDENGEIKQEKTDVSMLDLTDLENKRFIYPL